MKLQDYIRTCLGVGKYFFTKNEALLRLGLNQNQFSLQAQRLYKKKILKNLGHDFFMIIPAEYYHLGSLPPHWIIDSFMKHLNQSYYIGLLSAASLYGATEQQPMSLQVITNKTTRQVKLERSAIKFHVNKQCQSALTNQITVPTGYAAVSTKEQTMVDLVKFYKIAGYMSNVALVIRELSQESDASLLAEILKKESQASALQRLGYIFEMIGCARLATVVEVELAKRKMRYVFLRPDYLIKKGVRVKRWKLILNDTIEVD